MLVTAALLIAALALAPMVPMILPQFAVQSSPVSNPLRGAFPPGQRVYRAVTTLLETIMGEGRLFQVPHSRPVAMAILVAAPAAWLLARTSDRHRDQSFASAAPDHTTRKPTSTTMSPAIVLGIITIVPLVILAVLNATGVTLVFPRHGIVALPGLLLWLAYLIDGLPFRHTQIVIGGAVAALLLVSLVDFESHGIQVADWRGAARYVAAHSAPGEPVFVAPGYESLPFQYYYPWPGAVVPVPGPIHLNVDDDLGTVLRDSAQVLARLDPIAGNQPFWLVVSARPSVYSFGRPILEKVVAQYYRVTLDTTTLNIRLRHLVAR